MTAEGHGQRLDATADAEDRKLTVIGQTRDEQFGEVALGIDSAKQRGGLLTSPVGVVVATATQDEGINARQRVQDDILIGNGGNDQGYTACGHHGFVVALGQFTRQFSVIARDADDGFHVALGVPGINLPEIPLQIKRFSH